jgi:hypothetical protein
MLKSWKQVLVAIVGVAAMSAALAAPVTIDFRSGTGDNTYTYDEDGFRVRAQPGDHFENFDFGGYTPGSFFWHDGAANNAPNILRVDLSSGSGAPFAVLAIDVTDLYAPDVSIVFRDDDGNSVTATSTGTIALNFLNTSYLEFQIVNDRGRNQLVGIDNLRLDTQPQDQAVPEPASLALTGLALAALARTTRRRRS